ncbi:MAG: FAD-binding protein [Lentisphaeria bacterium]|nr:FAD-binding protein [Lentisphaeria bacterium]
MRRDSLELTTDAGELLGFDVISVNTVVVGAGAAGLKCAKTLYELGQKDVCIVVDRLGNGACNNSGSDKQTYYKLGMFGDEPDSPMNFARSLFQGGMMHGDLAYIEGLGSAPAFFDLCRIGVPFPFNKYGGYVGYKTDHDPLQRATSAGPKTSKYMFQHLLSEANVHGIPVLDHHEAVRLLVSGEGASRRICGVVCLNRDEHSRENYGLTLINAENVVLATGGPGEMYAVSVWPHGQLGSHGLALEAGVVANNLTELQYGLASVGFRWNLSGTYQQVIPDYYSMAADGTGEKRYFLHDYFDDMPSLATSIFLKGYQWPFHAERIQNGGSSLVDIAVYREIESGRRVYMDFMHNPTPGPGMAPFAVSELHEEGRTYLERSGALQSTPYERLKHMNVQSIDLYAEHNVDLREPLEIAVCAQHCNGGIRGNIWWESSLPHLFTIGELNGSHGVRPGGSALNSGQVGATRAAQYIANVYRDAPLSVSEFAKCAAPQVLELAVEYGRWLETDEEGCDPASVRREIKQRMSFAGGYVRSLETARTALAEAQALWRRLDARGLRCRTPHDLPRATEDRLLALTSVAFLQAIVHYIENGGGSRGGYMVLDPDGDVFVQSSSGRGMPHRSENVAKRDEIVEVRLADDETPLFEMHSVPVRPLPQDDSWFETTWNAWNEGRVFEE